MPAAHSTDDVLGDGQVEHPSSAEAGVADVLAAVESRTGEALGEGWSMPAWPATPDVGGEQERTQHGVPDGADDVTDYRHRRGVDARLIGHELWTLSELDKTESSEQSRDQDDGDQQDGHLGNRRGRPDRP